MATKKKTEYQKAYDRALKLYVGWALAVDQDHKLEERTKKALLRMSHWESHEREIDHCPYCERFPPLSF